MNRRPNAVLRLLDDQGVVADLRDQVAFERDLLCASGFAIADRHSRRRGERSPRLSAACGIESAGKLAEGADAIRSAGGRGSQSVAELALLDQVIAAINDRLGGNLTDADKVWVQQTFEYAAEDPHIQQTAKATTEESLGYVFDKQFEGLVLDRHDANADLIDRVVKDSDTTAFFTAMARKIVYELAREAGKAG